MIVYIEQILVQIAHFSCWRWYTDTLFPPESMADDGQQAVLEDEEAVSLLLHLRPKLDPASPEFLDATLGFLSTTGSYDADDDDDVPLMQEYLKMDEKIMGDIGLVGRIKGIYMDASAYKGSLLPKDDREFAFGIFIPRMWYLKAEIFVEITATLRQHFQQVDQTSCWTDSMDDLKNALLQRSKFLQENAHVDGTRNRTLRCIYQYLQQLFCLDDHLEAVQQIICERLLDEDEESSLEFIERFPKQLQSIIGDEDAYRLAAKVCGFRIDYVKE
ncbi:OLC1v1013246C1 [Oldenlandia corymbosa var. corymbosa]|uniref:OLC1v1013246C1 n=1 Tax=Oldenlandia corymbosa var. corymbosa TaxID=529605 RepID=A0AAV1DZU6_OLDCO|nr:OLC1v1013246C1 [Oldenlandia corymbosa var. corymbosa]